MLTPVAYHFWNSGNVSGSRWRQELGRAELTWDAQEKGPLRYWAQETEPGPLIPVFKKQGANCANGKPLGLLWACVPSAAATLHYKDCSELGALDPGLLPDAVSWKCHAQCTKIAGSFYSRLLTNWSFLGGGQSHTYPNHQKAPRHSIASIMGS